MFEREFFTGEHEKYTLIRDGRQTIIYEVRHKDVVIRYEVWQIERISGMGYQVEHKNRHATLTGAEIHYKQHENKHID